MLNLDLAII